MAVEVAATAKQVEVEEHAVKIQRALGRPILKLLPMTKLQLLASLVGESVRDFEAVQVALACHLAHLQENQTPYLQQ